MPWIKIDGELPRHRKTLALATEIGQHRWYAAGVLLDVWSWAIEHARDGLIDPERQSESLGRSIGARRDQARRYLVAMKKVGWIDPDNRLHEWEEWGGQIVRDRERDALRNRMKREHLRYGHSLLMEGCPLCQKEVSSGRRSGRPVDARRTVQPTPLPSSNGPSSGQSGGRPVEEKDLLDVVPKPHTADADTRVAAMVSAATTPWRETLEQLYQRAAAEGTVVSLVLHLEQARLEQRGDRYALLVTNDLHHAYVSKRYRSEISELLGSDVTIEVGS